MDNQPDQQLIQTYLEIVATDNYEGFTSLLTDDCIFSLMPIGYTVRGRQEIANFVEMAGNSRRHDAQAQVRISNWFTDGQQLCVEYDHTAIVKALQIRMKIDGYCWVFRIRDGKFDAIREYINPSHLSMSLLTIILLRFLPLLIGWRIRRKSRIAE